MPYDRPDPPTTLALIRVSGRDARAFLHAQTTQTLTELPADGRRPAAWLNAKGRVRALFEVIADGDLIWLVLPADNRDYVVTELGRYVLRAQVRLEAIAAEERPATLADVELEPSAAAVLEAIRRGMPEVTAALRERYIPQMLNLDRLGAVAFTKGCYPGQEIVARAANLGEVKRRIRRFSAGVGARPLPGDVIAGPDGQAAGEVNRAAGTESGYELLAVVGVAATELTLENDGRPLTPAPASDAPR